MTAEKLLRQVLSTCNWDYNELEECSPELIQEAKEQISTFMNEVIKADRVNVAEHATITYTREKTWDFTEVDKNSIINAPNIELL